MRNNTLSLIEEAVKALKRQNTKMTLWFQRHDESIASYRCN